MTIKYLPYLTLHIEVNGGLACSRRDFTTHTHTHTNETHFEVLKLELLICTVLGCYDAESLHQRCRTCSFLLPGASGSRL